MQRMGVSLDRRLAGSTGRPRGRLADGVFEQPMAGLRDRVERAVASDLDDLVARFELDRMVYDIELDAMRAWLRRLVAFDAYCAQRERSQ